MNHKENNTPSRDNIIIFCNSNNISNNIANRRNIIIKKKNIPNIINNQHLD